MRNWAEIRQALPQARPAVGVAVFSNRLARNSKFLVYHPGDAALREVSIEIRHAERPILKTSPLASAETLAVCLRALARQFDPKVYDFILVTKSHGNARMAMAPRLIVRAEQTNREELLAVAAGELADENLPRWTGRIGVTKDQYFGTLKQMGDELGMQFALVFIEACKGTLPEDLKVRPPLNIRRLYMTGNGSADYRNLNYARLLAPKTPPMPLSQAIDAALSLKFPTLVRGDSPSERFSTAWRLVLYWLPLVVFLVWISYRYCRRRRRAG